MARTDLVAPKTSKNFYGNHVLAAKQNIPVPKEIICNVCEIVKGRNSYSGVQQTDLVLYIKGHPKFKAAETGYIRCVNCTAGQKVEMKCSDCGKYKGKGKYNKTQWRKDEEEAVCERCNEIVRGFEPEEEEDEEEEDEDEEDEEEDEESDEEESEQSDAESDGGVGMNKLSLGGPGSTMPSSNSTIQTGGSTIYSSDAGVTSTAPTTRSGGWAKVPAGRRQPINRPSSPVDTDDIQIADSDSDSDTY